MQTDETAGVCAVWGCIWFYNCTIRTL